MYRSDITCTCTCISIFKLCSKNIYECIKVLVDFKDWQGNQ